jgi:lysophospholipase L1-like esterase
MSYILKNTIMRKRGLCCAIYLYIAATAGACTKTNMTDSNTTPIVTATPVAGAAKTYLALGDSYTIGQNVAIQDRFPAQTVALLRASGVSIQDPKYVATTGWTTTNLTNAIAAENLKGAYDVISLLIGVNDQYQRMDTTGYRIRFTQLVNKSIELAGFQKTKVFVLSIPDYSATPFVPTADKARVRKEIDEFNAINKEITLRNSIVYLDITPSTREAETNATLLANDGLHPSGLEYKKWAERLAPLIKPVLQ